MEKKVIDLLLVVLRAIGAVVHVELEEYGKRRLLQIGLGGVWELHRPLPGEKGRNTRSRVQLPIPAPRPHAAEAGTNTHADHEAGASAHAEASAAQDS